MRGQHIPRAMEQSRILLHGLSENLYCRMLDRFASTRLPPFVMVPFLRAYSRVYRVNTDEMASPFHSYGSFREFFGRSVRTGVRPIDTDPTRLTCPVDGRILATGTFQKTPLETLRIKGRLYTLGDLLGLDTVPDDLGTGGFVLTYLAPGDYHRFHSPLDGFVTRWDYLPGTCRPVNQLGRKMFPDVYVTNRRVILWFESADDPPLNLCMVMIGAMGVGRIPVVLGDRLLEGRGDMERSEIFDPPLQVSRGQDLGSFDLGSSVLILWSMDTYRTTILAHEGPVRLGMPLLSIGERRTGEHDA
jgi:phosphatidylserine decarboxylase